MREFPGEIPEGFTGAVGDFKISSSIIPNNVKANNAATLKIEFKGTGNIDVFSLPDIQFPQNIEVFPPTLKTEKEPFRDQITGTITKEYILIPRKTGRFVIPEIEITLFQSKCERVEKYSTHSFEISVEPDDNIVNRAKGFTKQEIELLGEDIRFIRGNEYQMETEPQSIFDIWNIFTIDHFDNITITNF